MLPSQFTIPDSPGALPHGAILCEVFVDVSVRDRKVVLDGDISGFTEEFFLELLVAQRRAILVGNAPFLKGAIRNGQRKLPVLGFHAHDPVGVIPAAGL